MEVRLAQLRELLVHDMTEPIGDRWTDAQQNCFRELQKSILDDPCLRRFDHTKLVVLLTDFSAIGFGYVATQPGDDEESLSTMQKCMRGGEFDFY